MAISAENEAGDSDDLVDDIEDVLLLYLAQLEGVFSGEADDISRPRGVVNPGGPEAAIEKAGRLLSGNVRLFEELFRVQRPVFQALILWLSQRTLLASTRYQSIQLKVMIFLFILGRGCSQSIAAHFFGVSQSTVSSVMTVVFEVFRLLYVNFVTLPDDNFTCPETSERPSLQPFYACVGAVDGTHIDAYVASEKQRKWYNRKSVITQNVLCAVRLDGTFSYELAGAEGSVNDATLMRHALSKSFRIPKHRLYLGDAGFGAQAGLLTPYPGVRYHLKEWGQGADAPATKEELYNLRHSRIRIIVELAFGRLKRKFRILRSSAPEYDIKKQVLIVYACTGLWNFMKAQAVTNDLPEVIEEDEEYLKTVRECANANIDASDGVALRDSIAKRLWEQYRAYGEDLETVRNQLAELEEMIAAEAGPEPDFDVSVS